MHDQIVKNWGLIRSYAIQDEETSSLSLQADGGIYEFAKPGVRDLKRREVRGLKGA